MRISAHGVDRDRPMCWVEAYHLPWVGMVAVENESLPCVSSTRVMPTPVIEVNDLSMGGRQSFAARCAHFDERRIIRLWYPIESGYGATKYVLEWGIVNQGREENGASESSNNLS